MWGIGAGLALGIGIAGLSPLLGPIFSSSRDVQQALVAVVLVMAVGVPLAGYVFVLDGVLIGAGDARYLALAGLATVLIYAPLLLLVALFGPDGTTGLIWLWLAFGFGYMTARAVTLGLRARGTAWMRSGG